MKTGLKRLALNKGSTKLVLGASLLALCVILASVWNHEPQQELPATPNLAFERMVKAMLHKDEAALRHMGEKRVIDGLASWRGDQELKPRLEIEDFLSKQGVKLPELKEPWDFWQQWAKTVNLKKIKAYHSVNTWTTQRPYPVICAVSSGNPDGVDFVFEQRPNGWWLGLGLFCCLSYP